MLLTERYLHLVFLRQLQHLRGHGIAICDFPHQLPTSETNEEAAGGCQWEWSANPALNNDMDSQPEVPSLSGVAM